VGGRLACAASLAALFVVAGCGQQTPRASTTESSPIDRTSTTAAASALSRRQFIRRADALCTRIGQHFFAAPFSAPVLHDLRTERLKRRDMPELARYTGALMRAAAPQEPKLERLLRQTNDPVIQQWSKMSDRATAGLTAVHRTAVARNFAAFTKAVIANAQAARDYISFSGHVGFRQCGRAPSR
jgi:hypothetical protein